MVDPQAGRVNFKKAAPPVKLLSVEGLKKALRFVEDIAILFLIYWKQFAEVFKILTKRVGVIFDFTKRLYKPSILQVKLALTCFMVKCKIHSTLH